MWLAARRAFEELVLTITTSTSECHHLAREGDEPCSKASSRARCVASFVPYALSPHLAGTKVIVWSMHRYPTTFCNDVVGTIVEALNSAQRVHKRPVHRLQIVFRRLCCFCKVGDPLLLIFRALKLYHYRRGRPRILQRRTTQSSWASESKTSMLQ